MMRRPGAIRPLMVIIFAIMLFAPFTSRAQTDKKPAEINFIQNQWLEALHQAQLQNKYIFVDAYATWCGPCNLLKNITFKNSKAAAFFNANYINIAMDMERGDGPELARQWSIQVYPTLIVFDANGKPVTETFGFMTAGALIRFGKAALNKTAAE